MTVPYDDRVKMLEDYCLKGIGLEEIARKSCSTKPKVRGSIDRILSRLYCNNKDVTEEMKKMKLCRRYKNEWKLIIDREKNRTR